MCKDNFEQRIMGFMMINFPDWHDANAHLETKEYTHRALDVMAYIRHTLENIM